MLYVDQLVKTYGSFQLTCSLEVKPGEITALVGLNGAGKSTAFKAMLNLITFESGAVRILGKDSRSLTSTDKENLGVAFSDSGFSEYLTIKDILPILQSFYQGFDKKNFTQKCQSFGLPMDKKIKEFSTGMKAKLKVLVAVSHKAKLLILDEPTAGLDVIAREEVLDMLRDYMVENEEAAILVSSHISGDLEELCDDLYMIHEGRIVFHEDIDRLLGQYGILKVEEDQFNSLDKSQLLKIKKEPYGYRCLTNQKQYYLENCPGLVLEKSGIDELMMMIVKGEEK